MTIENSSWQNIGNSAPPSTDDGAGKVATAKDEASSVAANAAEATKDVAATAVDQAKQVTAEATNQVKDLFAQAQTELGAQAGAQQERLTTGLHALSDELHAMADGSEQNGLAAGLARQAGQHSRDVASWLEGREPGDVLTEVRQFAASRPLAFLALAAGAGLLAGRVTRGVKDAPSTPSSTSGASGPSPTVPNASYLAPISAVERPYASGSLGNTAPTGLDADGGLGVSAGNGAYESTGIGEFTPGAGAVYRT